MRTKVIILFLLASAVAMAGPRGFFGVGVGFPYYAYAATYPVGYYAGPVPYAAYAPYPGPGYTWIGGYWYPYGPRWVWRPGYWARPPYRGAYWVRPRYFGGHYYRGYWRR